MQNNSDVISSYPKPPPFYKLYSKNKLIIDNNANITPPNPPNPPKDNYYHFGEIYSPYVLLKIIKKIVFRRYIFTIIK